MDKEKYNIGNKFYNIKEIFDSGNYELEQFDYITRDLIHILGGLTMIGYKGDDVIEGTKLDLWKDRVYHLIERAGLLPEYKDPDTELGSSTLDISDELWYKDEDEFGFDKDEFEKSIDI